MEMKSVESAEIFPPENPVALYSSTKPMPSMDESVTKVTIATLPLIVTGIPSNRLRIFRFSHLIGNRLIDLEYFRHSRRIYVFT